MTPHEIETLASIGYRAYYADANGMNYLGRPMPPWENLPSHAKKAWMACVVGIIQATGALCAMEGCPIARQHPH